MQQKRVCPPAPTFASATLLLLALGGMPLLAETPPPDGPHDIYNPARTVLVNAQLQLAESSQQQKEILERVERMLKGIDSSLNLLDSASELDPSMKAQIDDVRKRTADLRQEFLRCDLEKHSTLDTYHQLLDELQALIEHY